MNLLKIILQRMKKKTDHSPNKYRSIAKCIHVETKEVKQYKYSRVARVQLFAESVDARQN